MKFAKKMVVVIMLTLVSLTLFACNSNDSHLSCSGNVTIENIGLNDVVIKSNVKNYATTNENGEYNFITNAKEVVIFPEKSGYIFFPKSATIKAGENENISFIAEEIVNLEGSLKLSSIIISPTTVLNFPDNFEYTNVSNGKTGIKAKNIYLWDNELSTLVLNSNTYLYKQQENEVDVSENISFGCGQDFSLGILINTYFMPRNKQESYTSEQDTKSNYAFLHISETQTNADLVDNKITYHLFGVNNHLKTITYNISFVFEYVKL